MLVSGRYVWIHHEGKSAANQEENHTPDTTELLTSLGPWMSRILVKKIANVFTVSDTARNSVICK